VVNDENPPRGIVDSRERVAMLCGYQETQVSARKRIHGSEDSNAGANPGYQLEWVTRPFTD